MLSYMRAKFVISFFVFFERLTEQFVDAWNSPMKAKPARRDGVQSNRSGRRAARWGGE